MTRDELLAAGYRKYERHGENPWLNHADLLFQKKFMDGRDIAFFIDVYWYDFSKFDGMPRSEGWQPEVRFKTCYDGFNVTLIPWDSMTIPQMEEWFWRMYRMMGCEPYERWDE